MSSISTTSVVKLVLITFVFIIFPPIKFVSFFIIIWTLPTERSNALNHKIGFSNPSNRAIIEQSLLKLAPNHFIDYTNVRLYDLYHLGADILVHIVGDGNAVLAVTAELDGGVNGLEQGLLVDTSNDEVALVDGFGTLGRGTDTDSGEGVADTGEERGFLGKGTAIADDGKGIHLKAVVVVEAEGLMLNDARVKLEA